MGTFRSFDFGSLGRITNNDVFIYRKAVHRERFEVDKLPKNVPLFKCYAGMDASLLEAASKTGIDGVVVEAMGVGNVPPPVYYRLVEMVQSHIPVVLVSRCPVGRTEHVYAYEGAGKHLYDAGVIFADFLNGQKARIKLMCALGAGKSIEEIRKSMEWMA